MDRNQSINNRLIEDTHSLKKTQSSKITKNKSITFFNQSKKKLCPPDCLVRMITSTV